MQTFSEPSIAERFISRSSLIYVQEGDRHVKALKLKVGDQNTSRPNTVVSDLWKLSKYQMHDNHQEYEVVDAECVLETVGGPTIGLLCPWSGPWLGTWLPHIHPQLSKSFSSWWQLSIPTPSRLRSGWPKPGSFNGSNLTFLFESTSLFNNWFALSPPRKVHPSTFVPAGGMQTYVTLQTLLHSHSTSHRTASFISTLCNTSSFTFILVQR